MLDEIFTKYAQLFASNGYRLYMIGGTSRDFLLKIHYDDYDFVTDATPDEEKSFLPHAEYAFAKFGSVQVREGKLKIDITTLRKEEAYLDHRHPTKIEFIKDPKVDCLRRDFTINAIYIDEAGHILDYVGGVKDLENRLIRFIGEPKKRIEEDPLRILRAERFAKKLGFSLEPKTKQAIEEMHPLVASINPAKVKMELAKSPK